MRQAVARHRLDAVWTCSFMNDLVRFDLDPHTVVFDRRSGYTHILDPIAAFVLAVVAESGQTRIGILGQAAQVFECDETIDMSAHVDGALDQLLALDLVVVNDP